MTAIKVPPLGESIVEATISRWLKNEGDPVSPGDTASPSFFNQREMVASTIDSPSGGTLIAVISEAALGADPFPRRTRSSGQARLSG
jgi:hypothetical protein